MNEQFSTSIQAQDNNHEFFKAASFSPDGTRILSYSSNSVVSIFSLPDSQPIFDQDYNWVPNFTIREPDIIHEAIWSPQSDKFISICRNNPIHSWDLKTGRLLASYLAFSNLEEMDTIYSGCFSRDGSLIYGGGDTSIRVYDSSRPGREIEFTKTYEKQIGGQKGAIFSLCVNPQKNSMLATGCLDGTVGIYNLHGNYLPIIKSVDIPSITSDNTNIEQSYGLPISFGSNKDKKEQYSDIRDEYQRGPRRRDKQNGMTCETLFAGHFKKRKDKKQQINTNQILNIQDQDQTTSIAQQTKEAHKQTESKQNKQNKPQQRKPSGVTQVLFSPCGNYLFSGGRRNNSICCWDIRNIQSAKCLFSINRACYTNQKVLFDISPDGRLLVAGDQNKEIRIYELFTESNQVRNYVNFASSIPQIEQNDQKIETLLRITETQQSSSEQIQPIIFQPHSELITSLKMDNVVNSVSFHPTLPLISATTGQMRFGLPFLQKKKRKREDISDDQLSNSSSNEIVEETKGEKRIREDEQIIQDIPLLITSKESQLITSGIELQIHNQEKINESETHIHKDINTQDGMKLQEKSQLSIFSFQDLFHQTEQEDKQIKL
ncbi:MAG: putative telomerase Cajal body protein 1 [Streblomastix strix]|uniref:Putative telomerase Cajal body protein 1 n=1 Tax=Streblomastix strix TaxID=222440 RepID=A0A5J4UQT2_9EUKA|nr:MAG: putative telomerase Cajal body protein 1 [Streblomastix strix]